VRRRLVILVLALAAVALVVFLARRPGDDEVVEGVAPGRAEVVVMGDSVTVQSSEQIVAALPDREVSVIARSGLRTDQLLPMVRETLGGTDRPAVAVVMAGYNDVWQRTEREAPVDELLEAMAGVDCAIWVLVPTKGPWDHDRALAFDARVRAAAEAAGVAVDTAWRDAVDAGDEPDPDPDLVQADEVHPSPAGRSRVAVVMAGAVDEHCG
jgi:lysophospholipase L1-like esterase